MFAYRSDGQSDTLTYSGSDDLFLKLFAAVTIIPFWIWDSNTKLKWSVVWAHQCCKVKKSKIKLESMWENIEKTHRRGK